MKSICSHLSTCCTYILHVHHVWYAVKTPNDFLVVYTAVLSIANIQIYSSRILWNSYLPSQVECFQYNNRLHVTLHCNNFSRHSIIVDRTHGTGLIILTQHSRDITTPPNKCLVNTTITVSPRGTELIILIQHSKQITSPTNCQVSMTE